MKLDLNDYYPSSNLARLYRTRNRKGDDEKARVSGTVTMIACERARRRRTNDEWLNPTLLGAAFDSGDVDKAQDLADQVAAEGPAKWKLATTLDDCRIAAQLHQEPGRSQLQEIVAQLQTLLPSSQS